MGLYHLGKRECPGPDAPTRVVVLPLQTVEDLEHALFPKTEDEKKYFLDLCRNQEFIERTAANLFPLLDENGSGTLSQDELWDVMILIVKKCADIAAPTMGRMGFMVFPKYARRIYSDDIKPYTISPNGEANMFDLQVLIRNSLLFASGTIGQDENRKLSKHFYKIRKIQYEVVQPPEV